MNFMNIRFLNKNQETAIKPLGICVLILAILLFASVLSFAEVSGEETIKLTGTIDQINDDKVVVNDCLFKLSPGVKFYTNSAMNTYENRSSFKKGTNVGFQIKDNSEVTAMWIESK
jgi:type 1 fimbria pilin